MNRRQTRAREYYGYALIAGVTYTEARRMQPGMIADLYRIRMDYDSRMNYGKGILGQLTGGWTKKKGK